MKQHHFSTDRAYRRSIRANDDEVRFRVGVEQTDLLVVAATDLHEPIAAHVTSIRGIIKNWILLHPEFAASLSPLPIPENGPPLIRQMAAGAIPCEVGPMAAVAGAVAQSVADAFVDQSPDILVENGGDIYIHSTRERVVALLPDPESGAMIGLRIEADRFPLSICSSSATIGHSLSLGTGELVTVIAKDGCLADAAATGLCNRLRNADDLDSVLEAAESLSSAGVLGVFAQHGERIGAWGDIELVAVE